MKNFFNKKPSEVEAPQDWKPLEDEKSLVKLHDLSNQTPVLLLKHSPRCPVSFMALRACNEVLKRQKRPVNLNILDVVNYRHLSQQWADVCGIQHESPQLFLLQNGRVVYCASHEEIDLAQALARV